MSQQYRASLDALSALLEVMARLRHPETGCPWDIEQTHATIAPFTIEEAYEVAEAVAEGDPKALSEELGDLLFQVVFQARIAEEAGHFNFANIAEAITAKMIKRHPHIFTEASPRSIAEQETAWEDMKAEERARKSSNTGILSDVARTLPAMIRAEKLQKRAARVGFDWHHSKDVIAKIKEELDEVIEAEETLSERNSPDDKQHLSEEIGDLLFAVINLARKEKINPEQALADTNAKFTRRFEFIENKAKQHHSDVKDKTLDELEEWWQEAKVMQNKK